MSANSSSQQAQNLYACDQNFYETLGVDQASIDRADSREAFLQAAVARSLMEVPFVSQHMDNLATALERRFPGEVGLHERDLGNERFMRQQAQFVQAFLDLRRLNPNKRKADSSKAVDESHALLGTTSCSTQEECKQALKFQLLKLRCADIKPYELFEFFPCSDDCECNPAASPQCDIFRWRCIQAAFETLSHDQWQRRLYQSMIQADLIPEYQWRTTQRFVFRKKYDGMWADSEKRWRQLRDAEIWKTGPVNRELRAVQDELRYAFMHYIVNNPNEEMIQNTKERSESKKWSEIQKK